MILIIAVAIASALLVFWVLLLMQTERGDFLNAATNRILGNRQKIEKLQKKDARRAEKLDTYSGISYRIMKQLLGGNSEKEIRKLETENEEIQSGAIQRVSAIDLPGYVLLRKKDSIGRGNLHKALYAQCLELYGKKYAENMTQQVLAQMLSYGLAGVPIAILLGVIMACVKDLKIGCVVMGVGVLIVGVLIYAIYDEVKDRLNKRRDAISRQFPNVVSKLALLVSSGMIMDRAWRETAESRSEELYMEMRKTSQELANLVEPSIAYTNFLNRCNTKETTKLASAVIQNQSKSNAEIGQLLKTMAQEAWQERRHMAKRDSEKANSKLMIPTMLLFVAILVMIMVPVAMNFQGL